MPGIRAGKIAFAILLLATLGTGCSRYAHTRVLLHGTVEDEDGRPVPFAVVRVGDLETLSDESGRYHLLYLASCLRGTAGIQGVQTPDVEAFALNYEKAVIGFHLDTIELVGGGSCPADSDKYLRVTMAHGAKEQRF
jgi:hypothetical protein